MIKNNLFYYKGIGYRVERRAPKEGELVFYTVEYGNDAWLSPAYKHDTRKDAIIFIPDEVPESNEVQDKILKALEDIKEVLKSNSISSKYKNSPDE